MQEWLKKLKSILNSESSDPTDSRPQIKMCSACGNFVSKKSRICEYCSSNLDASIAQPVANSPSHELQGMMPIFFICAGLHLLAIFFSSKIEGYKLASRLWAPSVEALICLGANANILTVLEQEVWRTFTYMFLHGGFFHIFMNLSVLAQVGPLALLAFGKRRFWLLVLLTGFSGGVLSASQILWGGKSLSVGLSGSLFGLIGALYIFFRYSGQYMMAERLKKFMIWGNVICILLTVFGIFRIDNFAHLGGMFSGMALASFFNSRQARLLPPRFEQIALGLCLSCWGYGCYQSWLYLHERFW